MDFNLILKQVTCKDHQRRLCCIHVLSCIFFVKSGRDLFQDIGMRNAYKIIVGKLEGNKLLERLRYR
jgi:hypothetical protein